LKAILCLFVCYCFLFAFRFHCLQPAPGSVVIAFVSGVLNHWLWLHESFWSDSSLFSSVLQICAVFFLIFHSKVRAVKTESWKYDCFYFILDTWPRRKFIETGAESNPLPSLPHTPSLV
jgi:hypothetical protein